MKKIDYKWFALALLWVAFFLQQGTRQVYGPLVGSIKDAVGATDVQLGLVSTVFTLVYGITIPFAGFAADLFSRKWMVVIGVAIFSAGILTSGFVTCIGALVVTYGLVNGFGQPFYYPSSTSLISQLHADSKATALSLLQLGMYGGVIGCSWLAGWFAGLGTEGWRLPFKVLGVVGLCWAGVLAFTLRNTEVSRAGADAQERVPPADRVTIGAALKAMFAKPAAVLIALALGMEVYVDVGFKTWMPNYLSETFGVSKASAGLNAVLWHYLGAALGIVIGSRIGDRFVKRCPTIRFWVIAHRRQVRQAVPDNPVLGNRGRAVPGRAVHLHDVAGHYLPDVLHRDVPLRRVPRRLRLEQLRRVLRRGRAALPCLGGGLQPDDRVPVRVLLAHRARLDEGELLDGDGAFHLGDPLPGRRRPARGRLPFFREAIARLRFLRWPYLQGGCENGRMSP